MKFRWTPRDPKKKNDELMPGVVVGDAMQMVESVCDLPVHCMQVGAAHQQCHIILPSPGTYCTCSPYPICAQLINKLNASSALELARVCHLGPRTWKTHSWSVNLSCVAPQAYDSHVDIFH